VGREACFCLVDADAGDLEAATGAVDWGAVSARVAGQELILFDPGREARWILDGLLRRGLPGPLRVRSLAAALRGRARIPRGSDLQGICHALRAPYREGESARDAARNVAACLQVAHDSAPPDGGGEAEPLAGARVLTPAFLDSVPEGPGIYRFFDEEGELLYVGKAANLRRRLRAHAASAAAGSTRKVTRALARLARVELAEAGSELEALLEEARAIRRERPRDNVQREVHERGRTYASSGRVALLLPSAGRGGVLAIFVDAGAYAGATRLGPRGGGVARAGAILARLFRSRSRAPRRGSGAVARDSELLRSWLARHGDSVTRVDLDSATDAASALVMLRRAAKSPLGGDEEAAIHRQGV